MSKNNHPSTHPAASLVRLVACVLVFLSLPFAESKGADARGGNDGAGAAATVSKGSPGVFTVKTDDGVYQFTFDTRQCAPELAAWVREELVPAVKEYYPKIVRFLPSKGFSAYKDVSITFKQYKGTSWAIANGNHISCNPAKFLDFKKEGIAKVIHEMTHVVQGGGNWGRTVPVWLSEGIADYVRYTCQPHEAYVPSPGTSPRIYPHYDNGYYATAYFLYWVAGAYDKDIVPKLTAVGRQGTYSDKVWKQFTGRTIKELDAEWQAFQKLNNGKGEWQAFLPHPERNILKYSNEDLRAPFLQQNQASPEKAK